MHTTDDAKKCMACECPCDEHSKHTCADSKDKHCEHCNDEQGKGSDHGHECHCS